MSFAMDKSKSKTGASVSEEFALFNWSSVGYILSAFFTPEQLKRYKF